MVVTAQGLQCVRVGVRCVKSQPSVYPWSTRVIAHLGLKFISLVAFPLSLHVLPHLFHFIFCVLRMPCPCFSINNIFFNLSSLTSLSSHPHFHLPDDLASVVDHFVHELEDEMCVMTGSHACASPQEQEPRPSLTQSAAGEWDVLLDPGKKLLPGFWLGSYKSALEDVRCEASKGALCCPTK